MYSKRFAMILSNVVAWFLLGIKGYAYSVTNSQAIFSDFMESLAHVVVVAIAAISLWYSSKPADREHRYGHGKAAYFSAAFEGSFIVFTGIATLYNALWSFYQGYTPTDLSLGVLFEIFIIVVNALLGMYLFSLAKNNNNVIFLSHAHHIFSDMWTSIGVLLSLILTWATGLLWIDASAGGLVGFIILFSGLKVWHEAYKGLMEHIDEEVHEATVKILNQAVEDKKIISYHQLRHRRINDQLWIEMHMQFNGDMVLNDVHSRATDVEMKLIQHFPKDKVHITTHLEPVEHKKAHPDQHPDKGHL